MFTLWNHLECLRMSTPLLMFQKGSYLFTPHLNLQLKIESSLSMSNLCGITCSNSIYFTFWWQCTHLFLSCYLCCLLDSFTGSQSYSTISTSIIHIWYLSDWSLATTTTLDPRRKKSTEGKDKVRKSLTSHRKWLQHTTQEWKSRSSMTKTLPCGRRWCRMYSSSGFR